MSFADEMAAAFPAANPLPPLLRQTLQWMDEHGFVHRRSDGGGYATLYPGPEGRRLGTVAFFPPEAGDTRTWMRSHETAVTDRLAIFLSTGGDGSCAGLWRDDAGVQRVVHLGSGSGSVMFCVLTENAGDLLRLLAIGYDELCWPGQFDRTPESLRQEAEDEDDDYPPPPRLFRRYVEQTLGLSVPVRASEIVRRAASMSDSCSDDPFWNWRKQVAGD